MDMNSEMYVLGNSAVGTIEVLEMPKMSIKGRIINFFLRPYVWHLCRDWEKKLYKLARRVRCRPATGNAIKDLRLNEFELRWLNRGFMRFRWRRWAINKYRTDCEVNEAMVAIVEGLQEWNYQHRAFECLRLLNNEIEKINRQRN